MTTPVLCSNLTPAVTTNDAKTRARMEERLLSNQTTLAINTSIAEVVLDPVDWKKPVLFAISPGGVIGLVRVAGVPGDRQTAVTRGVAISPSHERVMRDRISANMRGGLSEEALRAIGWIVGAVEDLTATRCTVAWGSSPMAAPVLVFTAAGYRAGPAGDH